MSLRDVNDIERLIDERFVEEARVFRSEDPQSPRREEAHPERSFNAERSDDSCGERELIASEAGLEGAERVPVKESIRREDMRRNATPRPFPEGPRTL